MGCKRLLTGSVWEGILLGSEEPPRGVSRVVLLGQPRLSTSQRCTGKQGRQGERGADRPGCPAKDGLGENEDRKT